MKRKKILALALAAVMMISTFNQGAITVKAEELEQPSQETLSEDVLVEDVVAEDTVSELVEEEASEEATEEPTETPAEAPTEDENVSPAEEPSEEASEAPTEAVEETEEDDEEDEEAEDDEILEELEDEELELNDADTSSKVRVYYSTNAVTIVGRVGTTAAKNAAGTDQNKGAYVDYTVNKDDKLVVVVTARENSTINSATYISGEETKLLKASNASRCEFAVDVKEASSELTIASTEKDLPLFYSGSELLSGKNNTYSVSLDKSYTFKIKHGAAGTTAIKGITATAKVDGKVTDVTKTVISSNTFKATTASKLAGQAVTVKVTAQDDTVYTYTINVASLVTSVSLVGTSKNVASVNVITKKEFKISANKGAELTGISISTTATQLDKDKKEVASEMASKVTYANGVLTVNAGIVAEKIAVVFYYKGSEVSKATINIVDNHTKIKPSISMVSSDDTTVKLKLSLPKGMTYADLSTKEPVYYKIFGYGYDEYGKLYNNDRIDKFVQVTGDSQILELKFVDANKGQGYFKDYILLSSIAVGKNTYTYDGETHTYFNFESYYGYVYAYTKNPAYETKLTLKKNVTTLYPGQSNVTVATASFTKYTTFATLSKVEASNSNITVKLSSDKTQVIASVASGTKAGKYTIKAYSTQPSDGIDVAAEMTVTVASKLTSIYPKVSTTKAIKYDGKPVTVKVTTTDYYDKTVSKLAYEIKSSDKQILEKVKIASNGVVTIPKDYVLGLGNDTFYVAATYKNLDGSTVTASTNSVKIVSGEINLAKMLVNGLGDGSEIASANAAQPKVVLYDENGKVVDSTLYTVSSTGYSKYDGSLYVPKKAGKVTFVAKPNSGNGKSCTATYTIKPNAGAPTMEALSGATISEKEITVKEAVAYFMTLVGGVQATGIDSVTVNCKTGKLYSVAAQTDKVSKYIMDESRISYDMTKFMYSYEYLYMPSSSEDTITVTNKYCTGEEKTIVYNVKNTSISKKSSGVKVDSSKAIIYVESTKDETVEYSLTGLDSNAKYEYAISSDYAHTMANVDLYMMRTPQTGTFSPFTGNTIKITMPYNAYVQEQYKITPKAGSLKLKLFLRKIDASGNVIEAYVPIPMTLKYVKTPAVSVKLASTYSLASASGSSVSLPTATNGTVSYTGVRNYSKNGAYNSFNKYFTISNGKLVAKQDLSNISSSDLTGYIVYKTTDNVGRTTTKTVKVTVKVTVPKTQKK